MGKLAGTAGLSVARYGYFLAFGGLSIFFVAHMITGPVFSEATDKETTKSLIFAMICLTSLITAKDKTYLIRSLPLRVLLGTTGVLGLIVLVDSIRHGGI